MSKPASIFERWDLDPSQSPAELTRSMQALARALPPDERQQLRDDWRALTTNPQARLSQALWTHPSATAQRDPWACLDALAEAPPPELPGLEATLQDALHLDAHAASPPALRPPFWPALRDRTPGESP
ncbi:hypothetical protein DV096_09095 [Bradymonadaceae bacterium TMQ3]|uniref:DUF3106 domain-containing protein n=1 Tax=Lujinxingia sediminis TaxID=2480984 RepID=A0ABY0CTL5_9DELT|nr:hypothetical protein [Lujinxingia sediminis]RDV38936.1 hypothetical protein DV096_09095 [Bradymonadaceae bacterium TMQ3]RVU44171.1 hypothetical protein EA187_11535 [Lujinxingia sediminis]TXC76291.1 hypothetical protein FRC91_05975 [Bradymonadales bacterium TMQ1]